MRGKTDLCAIALVAICACTAGASGAVTFFVNPDGNLNGEPPADPTRDLAFQAALTRPFAEFDFAAFGNQYIMEPSPLLAGVVRVRPNLLDTAGNNLVDLSLNGNRLIETWPNVPDIAGIIEGGAGGGGAALLNRVFDGGGDSVGAAVEFTFSEPVEGFGAWIMDDTVEANGYVLKITEVGGATSTSGLMDSGNGTDLAIEGFIGAVSTVGITKAVIEQQTMSGSPSNVDFFYIDHVQVGGRFPPEICNNGIDDNADGAIDCGDSECANNPACPEICADGIDNNGNGLIDCDDLECQNTPSFPQCGESFCADGVDNEGDGKTDCGDSDCFGKTGCTTEALCSDGLDNDGDGLTDCADSDCSDDAACPENCTDGIDNDADGKIDCNDPECTANVACPENCSDGIDNDGNGLSDCADPECSSLPACQNALLFFVAPDGGLANADPARHLPFQSVLTTTLTEFDFAAFGHGYIFDPSPLQAGTVNVRPNLLDVAGNSAADLQVNGGRLIETFPFLPSIPGIIGGGAGGSALLNRVFSGAGPDAIGAGIEFTFSQPVEAFGVWLMDDAIEASRFVLKVTEVGGATTVSPAMDSGNGTTLAVEGFIGAVSRVGITKAVIEQQTLAGAPSNADFFYVDHVQVGGQYPPCRVPFADFDNDQDVDMDDFGVFQACFTGTGGTVSQACSCADKTGDNAVDAADFDLFQGCASGASVPANPTCAP